MDSYDIDVLVMGSYHHHDIGWFIGSTAERVLHRLSNSVLVISPEHSQVMHKAREGLVIQALKSSSWTISLTSPPR